MDLLARLKQRPQEAMGNIFIDLNRVGSDRHYSIYNTIDWSYHSLQPGEQRLFRQLAVFSGGCSLEMLEAMSDALGYDSLHVWKDVESVLDKSLLRSRERKGAVRLHLLETIREYGLWLLQASGEEETLRHAHARCYANLVAQATVHLRGEQQMEWLEQLEREVQNLRAALDWLILHLEAEQALSMCSALWRFWHLYGYWSEGRRWLQAALALPSTASTCDARAQALYAAGDM